MSDDTSLNDWRGNPLVFGAKVIWGCNDGTIREGIVMTVVNKARVVVAPTHKSGFRIGVGPHRHLHPNGAEQTVDSYRLTVIPRDMP